ncbi:glycosyltransferase family 61 protein [uncultured Mucilaginibacter sp.]|uniref:glycosyltransferase family 61 protein n=1 Tax=uncultured Mucilaginibacter sp. TaxID=797541 RepID=UPI0025F3624B|nr:glycosyltransferase family 61 protein [uncultured Mucilaginibacter sp.]
MGLKANLIFWARQFPFVFPKHIITSCTDWIAEQKERKGVYFAQRGPWVKTIFEANFFQHGEPKTLGTPNEKAFYLNRNYPIEKASLFYLQNTYLMGHKGLVLTADHQVFQEFSHHFGISTLKKFLRKNPFYTFTGKAQKVIGNGAVLVSPESHNYYHWLNDVLPRVKIYESVLDQIDHFCISSKVPQKFLDVLPHFGIRKEKILLINESEKLHFDHLYVASLPGSEGRSPQWAIDYLRDKLIKPGKAKSPSKKIYFKRGAVAERMVLNEDVLIQTLQNNGFEIIDPDQLTIDEQVDLMQQVKVVIGVHGAALSNLLFSPDHTAVIEIFSPDYFRTDCYYTLSSALKLNYWYVAGDKPAGAGWGDIVVPEELLLNTIKQVNG